MKIALVQASWTPHSEARQAAARDHLSPQDATLQVITVASRQSDYAWSPPADDSSILFPDADYWRLGYRELKARLGDALDEIDPDVVVLPGWAFKESRVALGWAIRRSKPRVLMTDTQDIDKKRHPALERLKRRLVRNFDSAFVGGTPHRAYLVGLGFDGNACFTGCNVVDNHFFGSAPRSSQRATGSDLPTILSCVRLLPRKNLPAVLEALARTDGWRWKIAGDGPERQRLERTISELDVGHRVELLGHVPYKDLPELYSSVDAYLQPSLSEPWGLAVNEAMAAGLPVIVSDRCGCAIDLVRSENGMIFDPVRPKSLADALTLLLQQEEKWPLMGQASKDRIATWGLDLFARNLDEACRHAVLRTTSKTVRPSVLGRLL